MTYNTIHYKYIIYVPEKKNMFYGISYLWMFLRCEITLSRRYKCMLFRINYHRRILFSTWNATLIFFVDYAIKTAPMDSIWGEKENYWNTVITWYLYKYLEIKTKWKKLSGPYTK